jgi:SAM-dependent methyltransferase
MASPVVPHSSKQARATNAVRLAQIGDLDAAKIAFEDAIALDRRNPDLLFNLAIVEEQRGDADAAASRLTHVLALKPTFPQAASRLSRLLARFQISDLLHISEAGLKAALLTPSIGHQPIVDMALTWQFSAGTGRAPVDGVKDCSQLLILALRGGIVKNHHHELALTKTRASLLLHCDAARFEDRELMELAVALLVQGWNNDHAWAETPAETAALDALAIDRQRLASGDIEASRRFLLHALYRQLDQIVTPPVNIDEARRLKPRPLRDTITPHLEARARQRQLAQNIPVLRPLADATSRKVAAQYEAAPYPRWQSLHRSQPGSLKRALERHFPIDTLAFMDGQFDVLIAGCGTGQQALQSAVAYGPQAHLTAMDLSAASLGYASNMAVQHAIDNVSFVQGDILDCGLLDRAFDIIECVGVLHHMADWRAGCTALQQKLKPGGLMYIGLYSAASRANLKGLRAEPDYPGPGCSDAAARDYRHQLMMRADGTPGSELKVSRDFYALHAFRDLVLHESEAHVTLEGIAEFLKHNGLAFRGFTIEPQVAAEFAVAFPQSPSPGSLTDWALFENAHPRTFDGMYRFWVERDAGLRL